MPSEPQTTIGQRSVYRRVIDGLNDAVDVVKRAKEIDPGAWSLNGTEPRRQAAVLKAAKELGQ